MDTTKQQNIFTIIAEGVANTNRNVVDAYAEIQTLSQKIDLILQALYPANEDGTDEKVK
jgi:hypothetical protein